MADPTFEMKDETLKRMATEAIASIRGVERKDKVVTDKAVAPAPDPAPLPTAVNREKMDNLVAETRSIALDLSREVREGNDEVMRVISARADELRGQVGEFFSDVDAANSAFIVMRDALATIRTRFASPMLTISKRNGK